MVATGILDKSATAGQSVMQGASAEQRTLYRAQMDAFAGGLERMRPTPVHAVVNTMIRAVETRRPKARYPVGRDARMIALLDRVPTRLRDLMLARSFGLARSGPPAA